MIKPASLLLRQPARNLLAGSAIVLGTLHPSPAKAQGAVNANETVSWSGIATDAYGFSLGAKVSGSITFNPYSLLLVNGNGSANSGSTYSCASATASVTINDITSTFQGAMIALGNNLLDSTYQHQSDGFVFWWDNGNDTVGIDFPVSAAPDTSVSSLQNMLNLSLSGALPYGEDATFQFVNDSGGVKGNLASFELAPVATPEPSTLAMGTLGAAGLLALKRIIRSGKSDIAMR